MRVTLLGIVTEVNDLQKAKAASPMIVTPSGIVMEVNESQP